ncbi:MAG: hypothetical protein ABS76_05110 [Pelagibacterium sp. SCN 64-44]|nr:MAG: hypothetical protein ABS76_05110 [Pelagibacterium sp. SCN 64-44]
MTMLAALALTGAAQAGECTIGNARYRHDQAAWWLSFKPVPQMAASNQTAAFIIVLPNSGVTLEGAVYRPNGFGSPIWSISGPCATGSAEICDFVEDEPSAIYGNYGGVAGFLDDARGAGAPGQVILPRLAVSLWYSMYRQDEFEPDIEAGDVFTLTGCD